VWVLHITMLMHALVSSTCVGMVVLDSLVKNIPSI
jgi:hypothetical protein